jgi:hypothetical protein
MKRLEVSGAPQKVNRTQHLLSDDRDLQFYKSAHVVVEPKIWMMANNNTRLKIYQHYYCYLF